MNLQYISDDKGNTTSVIIPINEWDSLKRKYKGIEEDIDEAPEWHKKIVLQRLKEYNNRNEDVIDFEEAMNDIEKDI